MNARNIVAALTVVIVVIGGLVSFTQCGKADRALLARADSLLEAEEGDSAMMILQSIDSTDLSSSNNAYYALLYTQAQYKCYLPITSDSLISIAEKYYRLNDDRKMYARAAAYKGIALMEMGLPAEAIYYVKTAEQMTDSTEFFTLGWLNLRLGELFQMTYADNGEDLNKYRKALHYFNQVDPQSTHARVTCSYLGQLYRYSNSDSAFYYLNKAIELGEIQCDTSNIVYNVGLLADLYESTGDYRKACELCRYVMISSVHLETKNRAAYCLSRVYIRLNEIDSARMVVDNVGELYSVMDSVDYLCTMYEINQAQGNHQRALDSYVRAMVMENSALATARVHSLAIAEKRYDNSRVEKLNEELNSNLKTRNSFIASIFVLIVALGLFAWRVIRRKEVRVRQYMLLVEQLQNVKPTNATEYLQNNSHIKLREAVVKRLSLIGEMITLSYEYKSNGVLFAKKFDELIARDPLSSEAYNDILDVVNSGYFGLIDHLRDQYVALNETELLICALTCIGYTSQQVYVILGTASIEVTYNRKYKIGKKLGVKGDLKITLENIVEQLKN